MPEFDWTTISADIAAAIDFVTEHGGAVFEVSAGPFGASVCAKGDADTLRNIGGSWDFYVEYGGVAPGVVVRQTVADVVISIGTDDPAVIGAYLATTRRKSVDWSADND